MIYIVLKYFKNLLALQKIQWVRNEKKNASALQSNADSTNHWMCSS